MVNYDIKNLIAAAITAHYAQIIGLLVDVQISEIERLDKPSTTMGWGTLEL